MDEATPFDGMTTRVCSHWHVINGQSGPILTYGAIVSRSSKQLRLIESQYCRVCHNSLPRRNSEPCSVFGFMVRIIRYLSRLDLPSVVAVQIAKAVRLALARCASPHSLRCRVGSDS